MRNNIFDEIPFKFLSALGLAAACERIHYTNSGQAGNFVRFCEAIVREGLRLSSPLRVAAGAFI
jgi:ligand-binding sensor protein